MKKYYRVIGIVILIIICTRIDFKKAAEQFLRINFLDFILINLMMVPGIFIKSARWRYLLRLQGIDYPMASSFLAYLAGIGAGIITPGRVGEAVKAMYLKEDKSVPVSEGLASIFVDRSFDMYVLLMLGWAGFISFFGMRDPRYMWLLVLMTLMLLLIPLLLLNRKILEHAAGGIYRSMIRGVDDRIFDGKFKDFFTGVKAIVTKNLLPAFFLTFAAYILYFTQCYLLARLISVDISFMAIVMFVSIVNIVSILPITILGIGTRDVSLVLLFSLVGLSAESAVAYSFILFLSFYAVSGIFAFIGWNIKSRVSPAVGLRGGPGKQ